MKNLIARLFRYKWTGIAFALSLTLVLTGWIWAWVILRGSSALTLHFSAYTGINRVGSLYDLHTFGFLGLLMLALNWLIAMSFEERDWFLGKLTAFAGLVLGTLIFIGFMVIMNVN